MLHAKHIGLRLISNTSKQADKNGNKQVNCRDATFRERDSVRWLRILGDNRMHKTCIVDRLRPPAPCV